MGPLMTYSGSSFFKASISRMPDFLSFLNSTLSIAAIRVLSSTTRLCSQ